jgi:hypothetical protein
METLNRLQQAAFERETSILWNAATSSEEFVFKSIEDILEENRELKSQLDYFKGVLDDNITEILNSLQIHQADINDLRIRQGHTSDEVADQLTMIQENDEDISCKNITDTQKYRTRKTMNGNLNFSVNKNNVLSFF